MEHFSNVLPTYTPYMSSRRARDIPLINCRSVGCTLVWHQANVHAPLVCQGHLGGLAISFRGGANSGEIPICLRSIRLRIGSPQPLAPGKSSFQEARGKLLGVAAGSRSTSGCHCPATIGLFDVEFTKLRVASACQAGHHTLLEAWQPARSPSSPLSSHTLDPPPLPACPSTIIVQVVPQLSARARHPPRAHGASPSQPQPWDVRTPPLSQP